jgi:hypothetical protein
MIASFFQHLEQQQVKWLLVSGQATILYGAATFSEDVDLWVEPSPENLCRLADALRASHASYYKLTPALTAELAARHHGFHFTIPEQDSGGVLYLDVMGCPPRVGSFPKARQRARQFESQWGTLPTLGILDLVELKKTQRPRDYPIISRLVLAFMREKGTAASLQDKAWAVSNVFSLSEFTQLVREFPSVAALLGSMPALQEATERLLRDLDLPVALEDEVEELFDRRVAVLRKADRHFWRSVIDELRQLRANGQLMPEGAPV